SLPELFPRLAQLGQRCPQTSVGGIAFLPCALPARVGFLHTRFPPLVTRIGNGADLLAPDEAVMAAQARDGAGRHLARLLEAAIDEVVGLNGRTRQAAQNGVFTVQAVVPELEVVPPGEACRVTQQRSQGVVPVHVVAQRPDG